MTVRHCNYCDHTWRDRLTKRRGPLKRCPECNHSLIPGPGSRVRITIQTRWLKEQIKRTVGELEELPFDTDNVGRRNFLSGELKALNEIERIYVLEEDPLDAEEMRVLNAMPEGVTERTSVRKEE